MRFFVSNLGPKLHRTGARFTRWLVAHNLAVPRVSLGTVFERFGVLEFFPGVSPAQELVERTTDVFSLGLLPAGVGIVMVAILECEIGPGLISGRFMRLALLLLGLQTVARCRRCSCSPATSSPAPTTRPPWRPGTLSRTWSW